MKNILVIGCKDIYLREFMLKDLDALYELTLQREITDLLPDWISTKDQREKWLIEDIQENKDFLEALPSVGEQCLRLAIVLKETNEMIGWCCSGIEDELPPPNRGISYAISKDHRGKGYTTQAAQGLINYFFNQTDVEELSALALLHNVSSNRVIKKCGFNYIGTVEIGKKEFNNYKIYKNTKI